MQYNLFNRMYSIIIAVLFYGVGLWLMKVEWAKDPAARSVWSILSAILSLTVGIAVTLVWLLAVLV